MKQHSDKLYAQVYLFRWLVSVTWNSWCVNCYHTSCTDFYVSRTFVTPRADFSHIKRKFSHFMYGFQYATCTSPIMHLVCAPNILHNLWFSFLLGITAVPREIENNAYAKFWGVDQVHYGRCASGVSSPLAFSAILTVSNIYKLIAYHGNWLSSFNSKRVTRRTFDTKQSTNIPRISLLHILKNKNKDTYICQRQNYFQGLIAMWSSLLDTWETREKYVSSHLTYTLWGRRKLKHFHDKRQITKCHCHVIISFLDKWGTREQYASSYMP